MGKADIKKRLEGYKKQLITKTALIPDLKVGVFDRAVFGIENSG